MSAVPDRSSRSSAAGRPVDGSRDGAAGDDGAATRVFLGWGQPALAAVADELLQRFGDDLHELVVALPGGRAGRRLEELLVERGVVRPAQITTAGQLSDRLLQLEQIITKRSARTLTWARVLRACPDLSALLTLRPGDDDVAGWLALAAEVRGLHGELVIEELGFEDVASRLAQDGGPPSEVVRWELLARLQRDYRAELALHGLADPHDARWQALRAGALDASLRVVLVSVIEMPMLLRRTLQACGARVTAFVCAPTSEEASFDELGALRSEAFAHRTLPLDLAHWWVEEDPGAQARRVLSLLAEHSDQRSAAEITVGLPDEQLQPAVVSALASVGIPARGAQGSRLDQGAVCQLLTALAAHLAGRGVDTLAALLRHPDLQTSLDSRVSAAEDGDRSPAEWLDAWCAEHLPGQVPRRWLALPDDPRDAERARHLGQLCSALDQLLGELTLGQRRPWSRWVLPVRELLLSVYGDWDLSRLDRPAPDDPQAAARFAERRLVHRSLELAGRSLDELAALPLSLVEGWDVAAADALQWVADEVSEGFLPGAPDDDAIELLGWLELPLDDAPLLIVTGFNDGVVPQSINGHAYLPDALRRRLGLPDNEHRLARDAAALTMMVHSRPEVHCIGGRYSLIRDPLLPSRLAFACERSELPRRVQAAFPAAAPSAAADSAQKAAPRTASGTIANAASEAAAATATDAARRAGALGTTIVPPCPAPTRPLEAMSVTAFGAYLRSPYGFYLERLLGLRRAEDGQREMDGLVFGNVTHTVLERFGRGAQKDASDPASIDAVLQDLLHEVAAERFGTAPQAAVAVQLQQLSRRLTDFAGNQARWAADGWRIQAVEWSPEGGSVPFIVDGEAIALRGRIDRIDRNEHSGKLAILDYKTGETIKKPNSKHGPDRDGCWKDLQLPLYVSLAAEWNPGPDTVLGYCALPRDSGQGGVLLADWEPEELAQAQLVAEEIVRRVRRREFCELGQFDQDDPIWTAIAGVGLVGGPRPERFRLVLPGEETP